MSSKYYKKMVVDAIKSPDSTSGGKINIVELHAVNKRSRRISRAERMRAFFEIEDCNIGGANQYEHFC